MSQDIPNLGQGTTSTIAMTVDNYDLTQAKEIRVTIDQNGRKLNFTGDRVMTIDDEGGTILMVHLTQSETLSLRPTLADVQVRWLDTNNEAYKTEIETINIKKALYKGVLGEAST